MLLGDTILETSQHSRCQPVNQTWRPLERGFVLPFWASASILLSYSVLAGCPLHGCFTSPELLLSSYVSGDSTECTMGCHYQSLCAWTQTLMSGRCVLGHSSDQPGAVLSPQGHYDAHQHLLPHLSCIQWLCQCLDFLPLLVQWYLK